MEKIWVNFSLLSSFQMFYNKCVYLYNENI